MINKIDKLMSGVVNNTKSHNKNNKIKQFVKEVVEEAT